MITTAERFAPILDQKSCGIVPVGPLTTAAHGRSLTTSEGRLATRAVLLMSTEACAWLPESFIGIRFTGPLLCRAARNRKPRGACQGTTE